MSELSELNETIRSYIHQRIEARKLIDGYVDDRVHAYISGMQEIQQLALDARSAEVDL